MVKRHLTEWKKIFADLFAKKYLQNIFDKSIYPGYIKNNYKSKNKKTNNPFSK